MFLLLAGCQVLPVPLQEAIAQEIPQIYFDVLFQDDFATSKGNWLVNEDQSGSRQYADGELLFRITDAQVNAWSYPKGLKFQDVFIEVQATRTAGDANNIFGILCRYQDKSNYYQLLVSSDGYYDISKVSGGQRIPLIADQLLPSEAIPQDEPTLLLGAECSGDRLVLSVNRVQIARASDSEFESGNVGLIAGAFEKPGVEVRFDDFVVWKP